MHMGDRATSTQASQGGRGLSVKRRLRRASTVDQPHPGRPRCDRRAGPTGVDEDGAFDEMAVKGVSPMVDRPESRSTYPSHVIGSVETRARPLQRSVPLGGEAVATRREGPSDRDVARALMADRRFERGTWPEARLGSNACATHSGIGAAEVGMRFNPLVK